MATASTSTSTVDKDVVMVFTLFWHGAQEAPLKPLPGNTSVKISPEGLGHLNNDGKRQAYDLGLWYRNKYDGFLSKNYKPEEIYVYSTDMDRTLMTAECCLAGMYPPQGTDVWMEKMTWQPIPVHSNHRQFDSQYQDLTKLEVDALVEDDYIEVRHKKLYQSYAKHQEIWHKWMKFCKPISSTFKSIILTFDAIKKMMKLGLAITTPPGTDFIKDEPLVYDIAVLLAETQPYYVKQGHDIIKAFYKNAKQFAEKGIGTKFHMYSLHDMNFLALFGRLKLKDLPRPEPCASFAFHLVEHAKFGYVVKMYYSDGLNEEAREVQLWDNYLVCPLSLFEGMVEFSAKEVDRQSLKRKLTDRIE